MVLGDLNVDPKKASTAKGRKSLDPLLKDATSVVSDPFPADTWTHYYVPKKEVSRLDYILPHKSLKVIEPVVLRQGLTTKCKQYPGPRYPTIGAEHTEASDHCPASVVLDV